MCVLASDYLPSREVERREQQFSPMSRPPQSLNFFNFTGKLIRSGSHRSVPLAVHRHGSISLPISKIALVGKSRGSQLRFDGGVWQDEVGVTRFGTIGVLANSELFDCQVAQLIRLSLLQKLEGLIPSGHSWELPE